MLKTYDFNTPGDFTYDSNLILVSGGQAELNLIDDPGIQIGSDFSSSAGFTFDSDKIELDNNSFKQKSQVPPNALSHADYASSINLTWGDGILTGTATGGAAVSGGKLDLAYNDTRYVDYDPVGNADPVQTGCIRFKVTPNYSGTPTTQKVFSYIGKTGGTINRIEFRQRISDGAIVILISDSVGTSILTMVTGVWNPTASTEYEFELNFDVTLGETRFFINGVQIGSTSTATGTRSSDMDMFRVGSGRIAGETSDFEIDDLMVFDTVQHTSNYTPEAYTVPYKYVEATIEFPEMAYPGIGDVQSYDSFEMGVEQNSPGYICNNFYWTGAAWASSNGTYAQASTENDIDTNISTLPVSNSMTVITVFPDSNTIQGIIDDFIMELTGQAYSLAAPDIESSAGLLAEGIDSIVVTTVGTVEFTIDVDGTEMYYNDVTSAWEVSTGQRNTEAQFVANLSSIDLTGGKTVKIVAYLVTTDKYVQSEISNIDLTYNFRGVFTGDIEECIVFGFVYDNNGDPMENVTVKAKLAQYYSYKDEVLITPVQKTTNTDSNGYWDMSLVENANMDAGAYYNFTFFDGSVLTERRIVPNELSKIYSDMAEAP